MPASPNKLSQFWQELKRRRVIQVIVFYATAAFVIIELVNNVTEPLKLPDWTPTFTIIFLIIGFPVALIFSWIFNFSSDGIAKTESSGEIREYDIESSKPLTTGNLHWGRNYDITPDGERFIMILREETIPEVSQINIVRSWTEELVKMVPTGK